MSSGNMNLVYFSPSGTTKALIATFADALDGKINEFDLLRAILEQTVTFSEDNPTAFTVQVFAGRVPAICRVPCR